MNFEMCILKQVIIDNVVNVDYIFFMLMGDDVVLCCEFIEKNVIYVNIDV